VLNNLNNDQTSDCTQFTIEYSLLIVNYVTNTHSGRINFKFAFKRTRFISSVQYGWVLDV